jgi:hypothetical protein
MKKFTLNVVALLICIGGLINTTNAQDRRSSFRVDAPLSLQGYKIITEIDSTSATAPWGTGIDSTWEGVPVGYDATNPLGCGTFLPGTFNGKFALIFRGTCEFGAKALAAQNAGAIGVIIVNNLLGVVGMGAGAAGINVEIPVVMVTTDDGNAIRDAITGGQNVNVSLTDWRFNPIANPLDIGFMNDGPCFPLARAIPHHQIVTTAGNEDDAFRLFGGGRLYNFSLAPWDGLIQEVKLSHRPSLTSGAFTLIDSNSVNWSFSTGATAVDSIIFITIDTLGGFTQGFSMNDSVMGMYKVDNVMVIDSTLQETGLSTLNNTWSYNFAINDSVYSKCEYDFINKKPVVNSYITVASAVEWGPVLYFRNPGYVAKQAQVVIMRDNIVDSLFSGQNVDVKLYKWLDDVGGAGEGAIDYTTELEEVGTGTYALTAADLVPIGGLSLNINLDNSVSSNTPIIMDAGTKYWLTVAVVGGTGGFAIGTDYYSDYTANLAFNYSQGNPLNNSTGMFGGGFANAGSPSIALITTLKPAIGAGINDAIKAKDLVNVYPNPTSDIINIDLKLQAQANNLTIEIIDITGKVITSIARNNVTSSKCQYNTSKLSNGTYFVKVNTENGVTQTKFTVSK